MTASVWIFIGIQLLSILTAALLAFEYLHLYKARQAIFESLGDSRRISLWKKYRTLILYLVMTLLIVIVYGSFFFF